MPRGPGKHGGPRPNSGAPKGPKPATILKIERANIQEQIDASIEKAVTRIEKARADGKKLAVDVLEDFMNLFAGMAAHHQPLPPQQGRNPNEDRVLFMEYSGRAIDCASQLAGYQSPKFKAIAVAASMPFPAPQQGPPTIDETGNVVDLRKPSQIYDEMIRTVRESRRRAGR